MTLKMYESSLHFDLDDYHDQYDFSHPSMYGQGLQNVGPNPWLVIYRSLREVNRCVNKSVCNFYKDLH